MSLYCDAIDSCGSLSRLSLLPALKLVGNILLCEICVGISFYAAAIDLLLLCIRLIFGRPQVVFGRPLYKFIAQPLRSVWMGEIPLFKLSSARYLTIILLTYHARARISALRYAFNRRYFKLIASNGENCFNVSDVEKLGKSFDLFDEITSGAYKFGVFLVGGPLIAGLSILTQHVVLPAVAFGWKWVTGLSFSVERLGQIGAFAIYFIIFTIWALVSAWMDMRMVLIENDVPIFERETYSSANMKYYNGIQVDIVFYLSVVSLSIVALVFVALKNRVIDVIIITNIVMFSFLVSLGLIALVNRIIILKKTNSTG
jgi:hypothetical protein